MLRIKRLDLYILKTFIPMFLMTFGICLFILLMQFLWKYIEDLVGKGLDTGILLELFFYATLGLIPMALPLAILLASLMTFGNLGERFELLAIKAAGISLLRAMLPLIILISGISIGAFFFQNEAMPQINVKFRTLLISVKQKSPELEIPEGSFYYGINNYNLYVEEKDQDTGMLYDVKIYDVSKGFDNMAVIIADSAEMRMSSNKDYLLFSLYHGQQFSNFQQPGNTNQRSKDNKFVPYSRENFREKEIVIPFDANFNRIDESAMQGTQLAKNIKELKFSIDSISTQIDSMNQADRKIVLESSYNTNYRKDTLQEASLTKLPVIDMDSLLNTYSTKEKSNIYNNAYSQAEMTKNDYFHRSLPKESAHRDIRYHQLEWHLKFTLSFACLIFFFIGAPLGAIIRKGGMGMPVVVSVLLFIVYYIIDNVGKKMARDGVFEVWEGVWLSSFILFPLGVFLTYKAMNDSALFNMDAYRNYYNRIFGDPKDKSVKQLYGLYKANSIYTILPYMLAVALFLMGKFVTIGSLSVLVNVLFGFALIIYLASFGKTYIEQEAFYEKTGKKLNIKDTILIFVLGIPLFPITSIYYTRKIKKAFKEFCAKNNKEE